MFAFIFSIQTEQEKCFNVNKCYIRVTSDYVLSILGNLCHVSRLKSIGHKPVTLRAWALGQVVDRYLLSSLIFYR